ncbi:MAG: hypothetical protein K5910_04840 [Bacteroidales bacterium]|nr:hypothetical protein [Bacteroidales bacterium]
MKYKIYADRVKLIGSHEVPKADFDRELNKIRNLLPSCRLWHRSDANIKREWAAHTWAYSLGIRPDKTADVDLDYEPKWYHNLIYGVVGTIALWVIK